MDCDALEGPGAGGCKMARLLGFAAGLAAVVASGAGDE